MIGAIGDALGFEPVGRGGVKVGVEGIGDGLELADEERGSLLSDQPTGLGSGTVRSTMAARSTSMASATSGRMGRRASSADFAMCLA